MQILTLCSNNSLIIDYSKTVSYTQRRKQTVFYLVDKIWLHYFYLLTKILPEPKVFKSLYISALVI